MDLIQFRVHPGVGMARIGPSTDWYFIGPEIPRFLQEQYPNLRHSPNPLEHPQASATPAGKPDAGRYRDKSDNGGKIMPQAARFRVFAYFYSPGDGDPYKVMELITADADIEWRVELANAKSVKNVGGTKEVDPNTPSAQTLSTKDNTAPVNCQSSSTLPNLAYLALEKDAAGSPNGRLHVIGNEGAADGPAFSKFPPPSLFLTDWHDPAADGTVMATVELKPAFTSRFSGYQYLAYGQKDPQALPADKRILALPAWVVVNVPDYMPDMGHFVSLWDLALNQSWKFVTDRKAMEVDGQHHLATSPSEVHSYAFFDYYTHIHPILTLFSDVSYASGQTRAGGFRSFINGVVNRGQINEAIVAADTVIQVDVEEALVLKVASLGDPFLIVLSSNQTHPLDDVAHEFVRCTAIGDDGKLTVDRGQEGTTASDWPELTWYRGATAGNFLTATLRADVSSTETFIWVDPQDAFRMPVPTQPGATLRDGSFKIGFTSGDVVEWMTCTFNSKVIQYSNDLQFCELTVTRGVDGTVARDWSVQDSDLRVIATASGHKKLDARGLASQLASGPRGPIHQGLFGRLRKPGTVYDRTTYTKFKGARQTIYPREFGRRMDIDTVDTTQTFASEVNIDPAGSLARFHEMFTLKRGRACGRDQLVVDTGKVLPAKVVGEDTSKPDIWGTDDLDHVRKLDDYYWIVSQADMPMLKEYALTHIQYAQFEFWANGKVAGGHNPRWAPLFEVVFKGSALETYFQEDGHTFEERLDRLLSVRPLYGPAFLDMASMGKMLGGSFLPGIEVGREGGKPGNWSLYRGGTKYFPDVRFHPQGRTTLHRPGTLTKDLAVPWWGDYLDCDETFWPTARPQTVNQENGLPYSWVGGKVSDEATMRIYWTKLGFIRRQANTSVFYEQETLFGVP